MSKIILPGRNKDSDITSSAFLRLESISAKIFFLRSIFLRIEETKKAKIVKRK